MQAGVLDLARRDLLVLAVQGKEKTSGLIIFWINNEDRIYIEVLKNLLESKVVDALLTLLSLSVHQESN